MQAVMTELKKIIDYLPYLSYSLMILCIYIYLSDHFIAIYSSP